MFFDQSNIAEAPCGDDAHDFAEAIVYAYSTDELAERIPEWFGKQWNDSTVHDQLWTEMNEVLSDEQLEAYWNHLVATKDVYRLVLAYLVARKGLVWESFLEYYAGKEEADYESLH